MLDIGFAELCLISAVALLVLGPERLPMALYVFGRWVGKWRRSFDELRGEFERQADVDLRELRQLPAVDWRERLDGALDEKILVPRSAAEAREAAVRQAAAARDDDAQDTRDAGSLGAEPHGIDSRSIDAQDGEPQRDEAQPQRDEGQSAQADPSPPQAAPPSN